MPGNPRAKSDEGPREIRGRDKELVSSGTHELDSSVNWDKDSQRRFWNAWDTKYLETVSEETLRRGTEVLGILSSLKLERPRILEIGCGTGDFLAEAQACGCEVAGIEYSPFAAREANERLGGEFVRCGSIDTVSVPPAAYDAVVFFDVIEHMRSPRSFLERVYEALRPGGVVALVTPSLDSWSRRSLGRYWMEYKTEHLVYFNTRGLKLLLETCGFAQISFEPNYKLLSLDYICWHFARFRVPVISPALLAVRRLVPKTAAQALLRIPASGIAVFAHRSTKRGG